MVTRGFMVQSYLPHTVFMVPHESLELVDPSMNPPFDALSVEALERGFFGCHEVPKDACEQKREQPYSRAYCVATVFRQEQTKTKG